MDEVIAALAAHPLMVAPYQTVQLVRRNGQGRPTYLVCDKEEGGGARALIAAHQLAGSSCFYCGRPMPLHAKEDLFTLGHVQPKALGGTDDLHNLVFSCRPCNAAKADKPISAYHPERAVDYALALESHHLRCLAALTRRTAITKAIAA